MIITAAQRRETVRMLRAEQAWRAEAEQWGPQEMAAAVDQAMAEDSEETRLLARRLCRMAHERYEWFVWQVWPILEPSQPLEWQWFHALICRTLQRVTLGELLQVLICIPPGFAKSLLASVLWPCWWWLREPSHRFLTLSSSDRLATKDSRRMREVLRSPWYRRLVTMQAEAGRAPEWTISKDQDQKVHFENTARGGRFAYATGGSVTGDRGNGQIIDDPHQVKHVLGSTDQVAAALGKAHDKVDVVLPSRVIDRRKAWRVTIQQRVHQEDVAGRQIEDPDVYKIILPMHAYADDHPWRHPDDPREEGELLDPVRMPEALVQKEAEKLERQAPGQARAQHEQEPVPAGGGTFQRAWTTKRYPWDPQRPPAAIDPSWAPQGKWAGRYDELVTVVDATFGGKGKTASHVSIQTWGRIGVRHLLLDRIRRRMGYIETRQAVKDQALKWRGPVVVELKALGAAIVEELQAEIPGVIAFTPDPYGGKEARAQLATPPWWSGQVYLPEASWCPWIVEWLNFVCAFPGTLERDDVDSMSMYFLWQQERKAHAGATKALNNAVQGLLSGRR